MNHQGRRSRKPLTLSSPIQCFQLRSRGDGEQPTGAIAISSASGNDIKKERACVWVVIPRQAPDLCQPSCRLLSRLARVIRRLPKTP
jgi:hypothetical protein